MAVLSALLSILDGHDHAAREADATAEQALLAEIGRQSDQLCLRAFGVGRVVYAERPKTIGRRLGADWRHAEINVAEQQQAAGPPLQVLGRRPIDGAYVNVRNRGDSAVLDGEVGSEAEPAALFGV